VWLRRNEAGHRELLAAELMRLGGEAGEAQEPPSGVTAG
jgi:hypothetical protein